MQGPHPRDLTRRTSTMCAREISPANINHVCTSGVIQIPPGKHTFDLADASGIYPPQFFCTVNWGSHLPDVRRAGIGGGAAMYRLGRFCGAFMVRSCRLRAALLGSAYRLMTAFFFLRIDSLSRYFLFEYNDRKSWGVE